MAGPFDPITLGPLTLENRFIRSATWEGLADEAGNVTGELTTLMGELAQGGLGLLVTGHAFVDPAGRAGKRQLGADSDERIPGLESLVSAIRAKGGKVALQINHAGANGIFQEEHPLLGPSEVRVVSGHTCREMAAGEIAGAVRAFGEAARRARLAGFDAVQLHAAHGYGISQFLSPFYNRRIDSCGGSLENRARYLLEAVGAVRAELAPSMALLVKINSEDFMGEAGLTVAEMVEVCAMLEGAGVHGVELSGGLPESPGGRNAVRRERAGEDHAPFYLEAGRAARARVSIPVLLVGGFHSLQEVAAALESGAADAVSLCRPLIREPGLVARWRSGDLAPSACLRDNGCFRPAMAGEGLRCVVRKEDEPY